MSNGIPTRERMSEPWIWKCEFCGLFYSKRTAHKHDICLRMYDRSEWEKDYYSSSFEMLAAVRGEKDV